MKKKLLNVQHKNKYINVCSIYILLATTIFVIIFYCFSFTNITTYMDSVVRYMQNNYFNFLDNNKSKYLITVACLLMLILIFYCFYLAILSMVSRDTKKLFDSLKSKIIAILENKENISDIHKDNNNEEVEVLNIIHEYTINNQQYINKTNNEIIYLKARINKLTKYKDNFLQLNKSKDMFLATISHEIRTPMNGIIGMLDIMSQKQENKSQSQHLSIAKKSAYSLLQMVNEILEYAKLEYSNETVKNTPIDLNKIIDDISLLMIDQAITNKTDIIINIDPDIQDNLIGDEQKIKRILTNLVSNAIKNTIKGNVIISLDVVAIKKNTVKIKFTIEDTGTGIKANDLDCLNKPFMQINTMQNAINKGSGLGLYITKKLVEILGGCLEIDAKLGEGSKFHFDIDFCFIEKKDNFYFNFIKKLKNKTILVYTQKDDCKKIITSCFTGFETKVTYVDSIDAFNNCIGSNKGYNFIIIDLKIDESKEQFVKLSKSCTQNKNNAYIVYMGYFNFINDKSNIHFIQKPFSKIRLLEALTLGKVINQEISYTNNNQDILQKDKIKCLIVEDDTISQNVLLCMLEHLGISNNIIIDNAEDAIKLCKSTYFDIIFMDYELPGINGCSAIKTIRAAENNNDNKQVIIISCSAHNNSESKQEFLSCGTNYHLSKPIILEELTTLLQRISSFNNKTDDLDRLPLLNRDRFLEIQKLMGANFINFIELYYKNCLILIDDIKKSLVTNNQALLNASAHKLKSSSSNIGAVKISTICAKLEQISLEKNIYTVNSLIEILEKSAKSIFIEFNKYT